MVTAAAGGQEGDKHTGYCYYYKYIQPIQDLVKVLVIRLCMYFSIGPMYVNVSSNSCTVVGQSMF